MGFAAQSSWVVPLGFLLGWLHIAFEYIILEVNYVCPIPVWVLEAYWV